MVHLISRSLRAWLSARAALYGRIGAVLCLSIPVLLLALGRHLEGVDLTSMAGLYAVCAILGYYVLILLALLTTAFLVLAPWPRVTLWVTGSIIALALFYFVIDGSVYRVYRLHIDAFWLQLVVTSFSGLGIPVSILLIAGAALVASGALVWFLFRLSGRLPHRRRLVAGTLAASLAAFLLSQAVHIVAYERNDTRFTHITPRLPFYYPIHSHRDAQRYAGLLPMIGDSGAEAQEDRPRSLTYPLRDVACAAGGAPRRPNILMLVLESWRADAMDETVSPHVHELALRSSVFTNHFSSGNSTPSGVFSLFYGIHPTYWTAVKANASSIDNPVLIDVLRANDYAFGIYADSHFDRHKIKDGMFRGIEVHEDFEGRTADLKDRDLTGRLLAFALDAHAAGRPFFGFAFYKSTHFNYYYPKESARFTPAHKLNLATVGMRRNRETFFNDYRNAVYYTDGLIGELVAGLEAAGLMENTIIVVTSDHGEEFDDNHANYWGHTGNFTGYQTRVPMVVYVPWQAPRQVDEVTAHIDIPPTLLREGLGCEADVAAYSNGFDLFGPLPAERPIVISSYVNHAVVTGDDVFVIYPMYVQKYKLWDINAHAGSPRPDLARRAMEEMSRFYRTEALAHP